MPLSATLALVALTFGPAIIWGLVNFYVEGR